MLRPPERPIVPHVCLPYITKEGAGGPPQPGFFGGLLGRAYDPLFVLKDPNAPDFAVPELTLLADVSLERLEARQALFRQHRRALRARAPASRPTTAWTASAAARSACSLPSERRARCGLATSPTPCASATAATSTARACCWPAG